MSYATSIVSFDTPCCNTTPYQTLYMRFILIIYVYQFLYIALLSYLHHPIAMHQYHRVLRTQGPWC